MWKHLSPVGTAGLLRPSRAAVGALRQAAQYALDVGDGACLPQAVLMVRLLRAGGPAGTNRGAAQWRFTNYLRMAVFLVAGAGFEPATSGL